MSILSMSVFNCISLKHDSTNVWSITKTRNVPKFNSSKSLAKMKPHLVTICHYPLIDGRLLHGNGMFQCLTTLVTWAQSYINLSLYKKFSTCQHKNSFSYFIFYYFMLLYGFFTFFPFLVSSSPTFVFADSFLVFFFFSFFSLLLADTRLLLFLFLFFLLIILVIINTTLLVDIPIFYNRSSI